MTYRKMTEGDIRLILAFVQNFEPESNVLRWRDVEAHSNFTRQALQAHPQIKSAFLAAKERLIQKRPENKELDSSSASVPSSEKVRALTEKIALLEHQQEIWRRRWYCIAYHIRQQGIQMFDVDKPVPLGRQALTTKDVRKILEPFDQDMPPTPAHRG
ncbi:hypothetical protein [Pseudomonas abietaniphila]|uniref:hypothetical protein n=1 Tax=Pseudomonas abietaniphila TaxID=89065 RepID=UPI000943EFC1|nr:hypothetical protein [Pseudomonas abietaniphila]